HCGAGPTSVKADVTVARGKRPHRQPGQALRAHASSEPQLSLKPLECATSVREVVPQRGRVCDRNGGTLRPNESVAGAANTDRRHTHPTAEHDAAERTGHLSAHRRASARD